MNFKLHPLWLEHAMMSLIITSAWWTLFESSYELATMIKVKHLSITPNQEDSLSLSLSQEHCVLEIECLLDFDFDIEWGKALCCHKTLAFVIGLLYMLQQLIVLVITLLRVTCICEFQTIKNHSN